MCRRQAHRAEEWLTIDFVRGSRRGRADAAGRARPRRAADACSTASTGSGCSHAHCPPTGKLLAVARPQRRRAARWLFLAVGHPHRRGLCRLVFAALRRDRRSRRRRHDVDRRRRCATAASPRSSSRRSRTRSRSRPAFRAAGWITFAHAADRSTGGSTPRAMDFDAYWAKRPAQLRNTAKRKAKAAGLDIAIHDRFDAGRLGRLRGRLSRQLEARGRLLPLPARAGRAGRRGRDAAARHRPQGRQAGRGAALAGREWRGDHPQARLCRGRQGAVAGHDPRHGDVPPRARRGPGAPRSTTAPATSPTRRDWMEERRHALAARPPSIRGTLQAASPAPPRAAGVARLPPSRSR